MEITINRLNNAIHFEAQNSEGLTATFDGSPDAGGHGLGIRPMEGVLMSLGSCSAIDVVLILQKMKQDLQDIQIKVSGERREEIPRYFTKIHVHYILLGEIEEDKAARAISLSMEKYCSVTKMLEKMVEITHSYEISQDEKEG
ncbi:MAG: OsmC family protein [Bacteroidota bacterium]